MPTQSALDYARCHGLAVDHTADDLLTNISQLTFALTEFDTRLPDPDFSLIPNDLTEPKLQLSHQGGALLSESIRAPLHSTIIWNNFLPEHRRLRKLKLEEPLLAGDHDTDVRRFKREASNCNDAEILLESCSPVIAAFDQGVEDEWNEIERGDAARKIERELEDERCHTTKEALVHLSDILKNKLTDESKAQTLQGFLPPFKRRQATSLTPPLMPADGSPEPYVPSTSELEFPIRSAAVIDSDDLLFQVGREMKERDQILSDEASGINLVEARQMLQEARSVAGDKLEVDSRLEMMVPSYAERRREREELTNMKLEVPMLSSLSQFDMMSDDTRAESEMDPVRSSSSKPEQVFVARTPTLLHPSISTTGGRLLERLVDFNFAHDHSVALDDLLDVNAVKPGSDHFDVQFDDAFDDDELDEEFFRLADSAKANVDAELDQSEANLPEICLKCPVPQLEKVMVYDPWDVQDDETLTHMLDETFLIPSAPSDYRKKMQMMNWEAIPTHLMKLSVDDKIEDDGQLHMWVENPQAVTKSEQMLFKRPGLRLFDTADDSDDEMEEGSELAQELSKPVMPTVPAKRIGPGCDSAFALTIKKPRVAGDDDMHDILGRKHSLADPLLAKSTSNALATFLDLRGSRFKGGFAPRTAAGELDDDPIESTQVERNMESNPRQALDAEPLPVQVDSSMATVQVPSTPNQETSKGVEMETLTLERLAWPRTVVIETAILRRQRSLINFLEDSGGDQINVVYREMNKIGRTNNTSVSPDIILSPMTGLIFTNFQALNQKSLPGQGAAGQSMVQSLVLKLVEDYDHLLVVIASTSSAGILSQAQVETMVAFAGFSASISSNRDRTVVPIWVTSKPDPQATNEAFNRCVWNLVCRYGFPESDPSLSQRQDIDKVVLINQETLWEQFLRRLGLNPMAAQIVIGSLRRSDSAGGMNGPSQGWGLRKFVQMSREERRQMFVAILGSRTLDRINAMVDERWG